MDKARYIVSRGSDDMGAARLESFQAAEAEAQERSLNKISRQATITTINGTWLATYRNGKLDKYNVDAVAHAIAGSR